MPAKRPTGKTGIAIDPEKCREVRHLTGPEYKVYDTMLGFAIYGRRCREGKDGTGPLLFNASLKPTLCNALAMSINQTVLMKNRLLELGWIMLVRKGARRSNGQQEPDTYRILTHDEYVENCPGECPPYEYAPNFETAQAYGLRHGQRVSTTGVVPDNLFPKPTEGQQITADAIAEFLESRTPEQQARLVEHWKSRSPVFDVMDFALPVRKSMVQPRNPNPGDGQTLNLGSGREPKSSEGQNLNPERPGTYFQVDPEPKSSEVRNLNLGENPIPSSGSPITFIQPTTTTTTTTASPPAWLSGLWSAIDRRERPREHNRYGGLKLRKAKPADMADNDSVRVSPDVAGVLELIQQHGENQLKLAWALFCVDPMPHCQPPRTHDGDQNPKATLFPVSVFLEHADSYMADALGVWKDYQANKDRMPMAIYYLREWHAEQKVK